MQIDTPIRQMWFEYHIGERLFGLALGEQVQACH
jgi:hypothetical protein